MNLNNYCLECGNKYRPFQTLPRSILKIHRSNQKINLQLQRLIDQLIDQKYPDHE